MEYLKFEDKEISEKFHKWWVTSFKGNIPINHPKDLENFAELMKVCFDKQDVLSVDMLRDFLYEQLIKGNIKESEEQYIDDVVRLYESSMNYLAKRLNK